MAGADIADALLTRCGLMETTGPTLPVALPDITFDVPVDGKYLVVSDFPNRPQWEGVSEGRIDQGLLQVVVVWPRLEGVIKPKEVADDVIAFFAKGTVMTLGTAKVRASREPWQSPPLIDDSEVRVPVTIPWTATPA